MRIYFVVAVSSKVDELVQEIFGSNCIQIIDHVWAVVSQHPTVGDVKKVLGVRPGGNTGLVIYAKDYHGTLDAHQVETISSWEKDCNG